jgi:hypothetical protein
MPDLIESEFEENKAIVLEVLSDAQQSATEVAVSAGISLSAAEKALWALNSAGRVSCSRDEITLIWMRT